ncbi:molybdenum cofactor synthesis domain protein [Belliella baltica DSM 15883]|uniref:Molybdopterin molybdenumtransferase n=3 Tax=Cyclobacteriaceae TaxID=563798 RepID=S2E3R5_INDAL|nr:MULTISPECIES: gephyrin-like molybdotransferase Glp [Cyclobacteriaceae]AFL84567.1 molybdenum cofactor synthesis domain protein [Belliella baltica DSM 15883]EOZ96853.1 Molybdopterin biosynthesis protein MoeA [Indibacter alkaliphilus LW1]MBW3469808.1 molybdopterin molybdenumtransferase MoeA [Arthrospiribacter ruber]
MISVNQAKSILQKHTPSAKSNILPLEKAIGLICTKDIHSPIAVPSFDNSAMDGYAISWDDQQEPWQVVSEVAAGDGEFHVLQKGQASRIFTGAPIPKGADTVIPQEWVERDGNQITFDKSSFTRGSNVRLKGAQTEAGGIILKKGALINPGGIGLLASVGIAEIPVYSPPKVAVIITGNELQELGKPLSFGQIYNSNGPVLQSYLNTLGVEEVQSTQAIDEPHELQKAIENSLANADILILSGGISVGDYDYVKTGLTKAGVEELFYKIKQRPGKPLYVGILGEKLIFALPGNPASVITCFNQYVKPSLLQYMGHKNSWQPTAKLPLAEPLKRKAGLTFFLKAKIENNQVHILTGQESFNLISFGAADCFAEVAEETEEMAAGSLINVYHW